MSEGGLVSPSLSWRSVPEGNESDGVVIGLSILEGHNLTLYHANSDEPQLAIIVKIVDIVQEPRIEDERGIDKVQSMFSPVC